jgi:hypothetical protein
MTYSISNDMTNVSLGQVAQILFSKGFTSQMNRTYADFDNVLMSMKSGSPTTERTYQYLLLTALGINSHKWQQQGAGAVAFPSADAVTTQEVTAYMKQLQTTVEIDAIVWDRIKKADKKYVGNPFEVELQAKIDVIKKAQARALHGDGSQCLGVVGSVSAASNKLVVVLSTANTVIGGGNTNWFHKGEKVFFTTSAGAAQAADGVGTKDAVAFVVESVNRKTFTVTMGGLTTAGAAVAVGAVNEISAGDYIYPLNAQDGTNAYQGPNVSTIAGTDFGVLTPAMAGLETLTAQDNRKLFGVSMIGELGGTQYDCGASLFSVEHIEEGFNEVEQNVGAGKYKWNQLLMPYNAYSALLEGKEADRRFNSVEDSVRGGRKFIYQYGDNALDCRKSFYCAFNRIWGIPTPSAGEMGESGYALEFRGTPFEAVSVNGQKEFLKPSSAGGYTNVLQSFLQAYATMIAKQPAACLRLHNFLMA